MAEASGVQSQAMAQPGWSGGARDARGSWLTGLMPEARIAPCMSVSTTPGAKPKARMPWAAVWPGALGATLAIGVVDLGFPLYLDNVSTLRIGTSAVFVLIALVWFYVIALIILAGAVVNELRFEHRSRSATDA